MCCPYGWVFWVQSSLSKGLSDFPKTWVCFPEIGKESSTMGSFLPNFIIKVDMMANVGN